MSDQDDFTIRDEPDELAGARDDSTRQDDLHKFLESVREQLNRFGVQVMVPDDDDSSVEPDDEAPPTEAELGLERATRRRCCFRLFPSGRRVCVPC